jgi:Recombination endonuclease VII
MVCERGWFADARRRQRKSSRHKMRYAEEPEFRARVLASTRKYRKTHKAELAERKRVKIATDPDFRAKNAAWNRSKAWRKYGLSKAEYDAMQAEANGICPICLKRKALCVDHCHDTNGVRGLVCSQLQLRVRLLRGRSRQHAPRG